MFNRENRTSWDNIKLGGIFVFFGGYFGVLTSLILGHFVNCMSGNSMETGMSLAHYNFHEFFMFLFIVCSFILGTFSATKFIDKNKKGHVFVLFFEAALLMSLAYLPVTSALFMAAAAMGLQNGLTTYITWSGNKIRTTHVTGTTTDIGVSLANKDYHETGFTIFQALSYLIGALLGFGIAQKFGNFSFVLGGIALIVIVIADNIEKSLLRKSVAN